MTRLTGLFVGQCTRYSLLGLDQIYQTQLHYKLLTD